MANIMQTLHENITNATSLANRMTLVRLKTTHRISATRQDRAMRSHLAHLTGTEEKSWYVSKRLFTRSDLLKKANRTKYELDKFVKMHTSAWLDDGYRALPNERYMTFTAAVQPLVDDARAAYQKFRDDYYHEVQADIGHRNAVARSMGKPETASVDDYPPEPPDTEIKLVFMPVPSSGDFRVTATEADSALLDAVLAEAEAGMKTDLIGRVLKPVQQIANRLGEYTGDARQRWHESAVHAALDLCAALGTLNIDNDPEITELLASSRAALRVAAQPSVRDSQATRDEAKAKLDDILSKFA